MQNCKSEILPKDCRSVVASVMQEERMHAMLLCFTDYMNIPRESICRTSKSFPVFLLFCVCLCVAWVYDSGQFLGKTDVSYSMGSTLRLLTI